MLQERDLKVVRPIRAWVFAYSPDMIPGAVMALEALTIASIGFAIWSHQAFFREEYISQQLFNVVFVSLVYCQLSRWAALFDVNSLMRPIRSADKIVLVLITDFLFLLTVLLGLDVLYIFSISSIYMFLIFSLCGIGLIRVSCFFLLRTLSRRGIIGRNLAVLGVGPQGTRFLEKITRDPPYFTRVIGVFSDDPGFTATTHGGFPVLGDIRMLLAHARAGHVDDVVVAMPWSADRTVAATVETLKELPVNVYLGADLVGFDLTFRPVIGSFSQLSMFEVTQRPISGWNAALKKVFDYLFSSIALFILSPLLLIVAAAIKLDSRGPVFFMQQRLGFNNQPFSIYKFRSMYVDADRDGTVRQARRGDPRVTRVGRIIRATSVDELPQLFNVLDGSMSLVGPRPHALSHNEEYGRQIRGYFARHKVKPGITGWAQVNGLRGETAEIERMRQRVEHDVYYTENWSLLFDIKIIVMTMFVVLFQRTAY